MTKGFQSRGSTALPLEPLESTFEERWGQSDGRKPLRMSQRTGGPNRSSQVSMKLGLNDRRLSQFGVDPEPLIAQASEWTGNADVETLKVQMDAVQAEVGEIKQQQQQITQMLQTLLDKAS